MLDREKFYTELVVLLLNQGRTKEAAALMERHEARREWETTQAAPASPASAGTVGRGGGAEEEGT